MPQLLIRSTECQPTQPTEQAFVVSKRITTAGTRPEHDIPIQSRTQGLCFTLVQDQGTFSLIPADFKLSINGQTTKRTTLLKPCDRIEWSDGVAVFIGSQFGLAGSHGSSEDLKETIAPLDVLQNLAACLQRPGFEEAALHQLLDALVRMSNSESGYLLTGRANREDWDLVISKEDTESINRRQLFSNTILQEALNKRAPVHVESIIGHPWAEAASVIEARIFSAACFPLCVSDRIFGAVFLLTRSPGRAIRRESLSELSLLASQAALLLASQTELQSARRENSRLRHRLSFEGSAPGLSLVHDTSGPMTEVTRKIQKLAPTPLSVLILGETGTGKEVVAKELHRLSQRSAKPFVAVNCAAIPAPLLESTLFGHERGAFTGAISAQPGKFVQAQGGTLLLDEIGDLPLELQSKLLRVLQERVVEPLGSRHFVPVDVRILAATHQDLEVAVRSGAFRQDLFFRLNGAQLKIPPLRERKLDIPALARHFLQKNGSSMRLASNALEALERHTWPGNVRELEQVMTRAAFLSEGSEITAADLELDSVAQMTPEGARVWERLGEFASLDEAQKAFTLDFVQQILGRHGGNRAEAAAKLGISERTLYRILRTDSDGREA